MKQLTSGECQGVDVCAVICLLFALLFALSFALSFALDEYICVLYTH
jgi:hypothetical protein